MIWNVHARPDPAIRVPEPRTRHEPQAKDVTATTSRRLWFVSLGLGGLLDCSLALYHSILPYHMNWAQGLVGVPDSLTWALYALNFSWSVIVFLTGCLVLHAARLTPPVDRFVQVALFAVGLFWLIHGAYTWLHPLPLPGAFRWLAGVLMAFPAVAAVLHWLPLVVYRERFA